MFWAHMYFPGKKSVCLKVPVSLFSLPTSSNITTLSLKTLFRKKDSKSLRETLKASALKVRAITTDLCSPHPAEPHMHPAQHLLPSYLFGLHQSIAAAVHLKPLSVNICNFMTAFVFKQFPLFLPTYKTTFLIFTMFEHIELPLAILPPALTHSPLKGEEPSLALVVLQPEAVL